MILDLEKEDRISHRVATGDYFLVEFVERLLCDAKQARCICYKYDVTRCHVVRGGKCLCTGVWPPMCSLDFTWFATVAPLLVMEIAGRIDGYSRVPGVGAVL